MGFYCIFLHDCFDFQSIVKWQTYTHTHTHTLSVPPTPVLSTALSSGLYLLSVMLGEEVLGGYRDREIREKKAVTDERWMKDEVWFHSSIPFPLILASTVQPRGSGAAMSPFSHDPSPRLAGDHPGPGPSSPPGAPSESEEAATVPKTCSIPHLTGITTVEFQEMFSQRGFDVHP